MQLMISVDKKKGGEWEEMINRLMTEKLCA